MILPIRVFMLDDILNCDGVFDSIGLRWRQKRGCLVDAPCISHMPYESLLR
jgi:hypothetical protein